MSRRRDQERHGTYWRNTYGRYHYGVWFPWWQELLGCLFWVVVIIVLVVWLASVSNR